jgi:hypothetical protein
VCFLPESLPPSNFFLKGIVRSFRATLRKMAKVHRSENSRPSLPFSEKIQAATAESALSQERAISQSDRF